LACFFGPVRFLATGAAAKPLFDRGFPETLTADRTQAIEQRRNCSTVKEHSTGSTPTLTLHRLQETGGDPAANGGRAQGELLHDLLDRHYDLAFIHGAVVYSETADRQTLFDRQRRIT
jgi:hypothetical protein